ncbi:hypothetical protein ACN47E_001365 [Coniothyrium glycines]
MSRTLEQYKGCDILDIQPGAGLWSQKLHEHLKPRSHILLEPRYDKFKTFLEPLLTEPDTKYVLVEKDPCALSTYREMVDEGFFPHQTRYEAGDPKAQEPNNTLLVVGSLVWDPILPGLGFDSMAKQLFNHFASAAWSNDLFHAFGLIRSLLWVPAADFNATIATSMLGMQKNNVSLEMALQMNLIVKPESEGRKVGRGASGREPRYEIESTVRALQAAKQVGLKVPRHRQSLMYQCAEEIRKRFGSTGRVSSTQFHDYIRQRILNGQPATGMLSDAAVNLYTDEKLLLEKYPEIGSAQFETTRGNLSPRHPFKDHPDNPEMAYFLKTRATVISAYRMKERAEIVADIGEEVHHLECQVLSLKDGPKKETMIQKIKELDQLFQQRLEALPKNMSSVPTAELDDRIALRTPPHPRIQWDQRPFEPLLVLPDEVWPNNRVSLIWSEPKSKVPTKESDWYEWAQDFVFGLYALPSKGLIEALNRMQHGLGDIVEECPSLKDPARGGRLDLSQLRVRMLTAGMIEELVTAYKKWPFKMPGSDHNKYFRHQNAAKVIAE